MSDTIEAAQLAAETEASRALAAEAAPDTPNPPAEVAPHPDPLPASGEREQEAPAGPKPLERITAADRGRADIAARFKAKREAAGAGLDFHGDFRDPSQTYGPYTTEAPPVPLDTLPLVGRVATPDLVRGSGVGVEQTSAQPGATPTPIPSPQGGGEEPGAQPAPQTSEQPRLIKVKVHGREAFLPEADVIAEAQKSLAAGNLLESAKEVLSGARSQTANDATSDVRQATSDPYLGLAQSLQLEGAEAAGAKLREAVAAEAAKARQEGAREAARAVRIETELAQSQKAMQAFEAAHPELAADEFARDSITTQVQREINADLKAAVDQGILKELPRTQDERNGIHTQLRAFGAPVRDMATIFTAAGEKYQAWRGGTPAPRPAVPATQASRGAPAVVQAQPAPPQPAPQAAPRVELSSTREQRRAAIPTQPTNGTVPPRPTAPPPEQTLAQSRSAAINAMRRARGQYVA